MKISTVARLDMDDAKEAIASYIRDRFDLDESTDVTIEFDRDAFVFVADFETGETTDSEPEKKTRRRRRTKAEIEADKAQEAEAKTEEPSEPEVQPEPVETSAETQDAPWETSTEEKAPASVVAKIFPSTETSAPVLEKEEEVPDPAVAAKSLFANLTKPTNGAH